MLKELVQEHINYTDDNLVPLDINIGMNNQTVVSELTAASPVSMATDTAINTPTGTTTMQESVSTSKRGGKPTGSTHGTI
jgi:hypothetical protein